MCAESTPLAPLAFMSYVRLVDDHDEGRLSEFRKRLSKEVQVHTGKEFQIFQDRNDIKWGQNWKERIDNSLDATTFLIPIITPGFFQSTACRDELEKFFERETELERNDLILPVYYVDCPLVNEKEKQESDPLAKVIADRQYTDWRDYRFDPLTTPQVARALAKAAVDIRDALDRSAESMGGTTQLAASLETVEDVAESPDSSTPTEATAETESQDAEIEQPVRRAPTARAEPPTHVVDSMHRGEYLTITEAINAAQPGDRILVRPGLYQEGLAIDKVLEIIGDGELGQVVIQTDEADCVYFEARMGRISNLVLRQSGGEDFYAVDITRGRLDLEDCDITSQSLACVGIHGGADPHLRRNRIHDAGSAGITIYDKGLGTLEENDIFGNAGSGVFICDGGNPTLRRNRIHDGLASGVLVFDGGLGTFEDNDIFGNAYAGIEIKEGGNPTLRRNRIHDGKQSGVFVYENGLGMIEDNDILGNAFAGISIKEGGNPTMYNNRVTNNAYEAIWIRENGSGTFENNDLRDNGRGAWNISENSEQNVTRSNNRE